MNRRFMKLVAATTFGTVAMTMCMEPQAQAFFPPIDPNQNAVVTPPPTNPIIPVVPPTVVVPPVPTNPIIPVVPPCITPQPPIVQRPPIQHHCAVPEPMTIISAISGLAMAGVLGLRRKLKAASSTGTDEKVDA
jgi:hypothetical protein